MTPVHNKRLTSIVKIYEIVYHQRAFDFPIYWGERAREVRALEYGHYGGKT
jgi:hypothetical protein